MYKKWLFFLFQSFLLSCSNYLSDNSNTVLTIDVEKEINNLSDIKLSEFCRTISYVQLETLDSVLIGRYPKIVVTTNKILVSSNQQPLFVFDRNTGKYLNKIGHKGNDPEGYMDDDWGNIKYWVDNKAEIVYFQSNDMKGLLKYDMEGHFIGKFNLPMENKIDLYSSCLFVENDTAWVYNKFFDRKEQPVLVCFSVNNEDLYWEKTTNKDLLPSFNTIRNVELLYGNQIGYGGDVYRVYFADNKVFNYVPDAPSFCKVNDKLLFKENFVDTLFQLNKMDLSAYRVFDMGRFAWPYEERFFKERSDERLYIDYYYCANNILLAHLTQGMYADKEKKKEYMLICSADMKKIMMSQKISFINDIDFGMDISIWGTTSDNKFFSCLLADDIVKYNEQSVSVNGYTKFFSVSSEDNPVIVILE